MRATPPSWTVASDRLYAACLSAGFPSKLSVDVRYSGLEQSIRTVQGRDTHAEEPSTLYLEPTGPIVIQASTLSWAAPPILSGKHASLISVRCYFERTIGYSNAKTGNCVASLCEHDCCGVWRRDERRCQSDKPVQHRCHWNGNL